MDHSNGECLFSVFACASEPVDGDQLQERQSLSFQNHMHEASDQPFFFHVSTATHLIALKYKVIWFITSIGIVYIDPDPDIYICIKTQIIHWGSLCLEDITDLDFVKCKWSCVMFIQ